MNMDYSTFWWLMVSAVVAGTCITKIASLLFDLALVGLTAVSNAGERLWAHLSRR